MPRRAPTPSARLRRVALRLGVLCAATVLALLAIEVGMRLYGYEPLPDVIGPRYLFQRDAELGVALRPGFRGDHRSHEFRVPIEINSLGLREREPLPASAPATRVLALGDSFTYGYGVDASEAFPRRLEALLAAARPKDAVRVDNAGAPSYGTRQELLLYRRLAPRLTPDLVVLTFLFVNDLSDSAGPPMTERGGVVVSPEVVGWLDSSPVRSFALERSNVLTFLLLAWMQQVQGLPLPPPPSRAPADPAAERESPPGLEVLRVPESEAVQAGWAAAGAALAALADETRAAGTELVVVHMPVLYQLDDALWERVRARHSLRDEDFDRGGSARRLRALAEQSGLPFLDLSVAFRAAPDTTALYFPFNKHLTAEGHAVAAEALARFLEEHDLPPR